MFEWLASNKITSSNKSKAISEVVERLSKQFPIIAGDLDVLNDYWSTNKSEREPLMTATTIGNCFIYKNMKIEILSHYYLNDIKRLKVSTPSIAEIISMDVSDLKICVSFFYSTNGKDYEGKKQNYNLNIEELLSIAKINRNLK